MRKVTCRLLSQLDAGEIDAKELAEGLLRYMSEAAVADFAHHEGYEEDEDEDEESAS